MKISLTFMSSALLCTGVSAFSTPGNGPSSTRLNYIISSPNSYEMEHAYPPHEFAGHHRNPYETQYGHYYHEHNEASSAPQNTQERSLDQILDVGISEKSILQHYKEWCSKFGRRQDQFRFIVFQRNYLNQFKWNLAAGKQAFTLNEFADCTEEEYQQIRKRTEHNVVQHPSTVALEVEVVMPDVESEHEESPAPAHAIDVEVVVRRF